jgi:hypothetical protein
MGGASFEPADGCMSSRMGYVESKKKKKKKKNTDLKNPTTNGTPI